MSDFQGGIAKYLSEGRPPTLSISAGSFTVNQETLNLSTRNFIELQLLVAVLIATVTFAAAFTMPGGYNNDGPDKGMATLAGRTAFQAFVISNITAFSFSITALIIQLCTCFPSHRHQARYAPLAGFCIFIAILGMVVAFVSGTCVVLTKTIGLRIITYAMLGCFAILYSIGAFLDPDTIFNGLRGSPARYVRNLLFDHGI